jgi:toxin FitB
MTQTRLSKVPSQDLFVSVLTVGEIERDIERQPQLNRLLPRASRPGFDMILRMYEDNILGVDGAVARRWGRLSHRIGNKGLDLAIAATALEHGITVATRNVSDFEPTGAAFLNPFDPRPRRKP